MTRPAGSSTAPDSFRARPLVGGGDAGRPDHRARLDLLDRIIGLRIETASALMSTTRCPQRRDAHCSSDRVAFSESDGESSRGSCPRLHEQDAGAPRVDDAEVAPQRVPRQLGDLSGHLDAGRPGADDDEGEPACLRTGSCSTSAASKAPRMRLRISSAPASDFSSGASRAVVVAE